MKKAFSKWGGEAAWLIGTFGVIALVVWVFADAAAKKGIGY